MDDFLANTLGELVGGALLAVLGYILIQRQRDRVRRKETARALLRTVRDELTGNVEVADALLEHLPREALPYSRFETNGWPLVAQVPGLTMLRGSTVKVLLDTYVRTRSANEQHELLLDLTYGATGAIAYLIAYSSAGDEGRRGFTRLEERRDDLRARLLRGVEELRPRLHDALSSIDDELSRA